MRMSSAVLCFLATLTIASAGRLISPSDLGLPSLSDAPDFCHGLECPPFKLLKNTSQYQLREYEGGRTYDLSYHPISYLLILLTAHCHGGLCHTDDVCRVNFGLTTLSFYATVRVSCTVGHRLKTFRVLQPSL